VEEGDGKSSPACISQLRQQAVLRACRAPPSPAAMSIEISMRKPSASTAANERTYSRTEDPHSSRAVSGAFRLPYQRFSASLKLHHDFRPRLKQQRRRADDGGETGPWLGPCRHRDSIAPIASAPLSPTQALGRRDVTSCCTAPLALETPTR